MYTVYSVQYIFGLGEVSGFLDKYFSNNPINILDSRILGCQDSGYLNVRIPNTWMSGFRILGCQDSGYLNVRIPDTWMSGLRILGVRGSSDFVAQFD